MKKLLITIMLLASVMFFLPKEEAYADEMNEVLEANQIIMEEKGEFRAAWLSHYIGSMPNYLTEASFKQQATQVLDILEYYNFNAMIIHFRTHNNALYKSSLNPKASWFGAVDFNEFDPMLWLADEAHKRGIEFHAWLNPYRLGTQYVGSIPSANPQNDPVNVLQNGSTRILDPGRPAVRQHIYDTILEIVENYPVDAIHFDDYFYANLGANGATSGANTILNEPDQATYNLYKGNYSLTSATDKANWRRDQINILIEGIHNVLTEFNEQNNRHVQFGISPTGIYKNGNGVVTYDNDGHAVTNGSNTNGQSHYASYLFADTLKWAEEGWIDYLLPQSYWAISHSVAGYKEVMGWWNKAFKYLDVNLYSGLGVYLANDPDGFSWATDTQEFVKQMEYFRTLEAADGVSIYHFNAVKDAYNNTGSKAANQVRNGAPIAWPTKTVLPEINNMERELVDAVTGINHSAGTLTFNTQPNAKFYYVYRSNDDLTYSNEEIFKVVGASEAATISISTNDLDGSYNYGVRALSGTNYLGPTYVATLDEPTISLSGIKTGVFYTTSVNATINSAYDVYYKLNNGEWTLYEGPITVNTNGRNVIKFYAQNGTEKSNIVETKFNSNRPNSVLPTINITGEVLPNGRYKVGSQVTITASSNTIWYKINHGAQSVDWTEYTGPITLSDATLVSGNYLIMAKTIDSGNVESAEVQKSYQVGYPQPTLELSGDGVDPDYSTLEIVINSESPQPQYRINNGSWTNYTGPILFNTGGSYKFDYRNASGDTTYTKNFNIVGAPEMPTYEVTGTKEGNYYTSPATLTIHPVGLGTVLYRVHNGLTWTGWQTYSSPIEFTINATYTVQFKSTLGGQESDVEEIRIRLSIPYNEDNPYVYRNGGLVYYYQTQTPVALPTTYTEKEDEVRAVWVATVSNIDINLHQNQAQYKAEMIAILDRLSALNFNTVFFQTRPMNDSFYPSEYAPFSRYLTGTEGVDPGWDVFEFFITEAHKRGIEVHAWMNPYRVATGTKSKAEQLAELSDGNFAKQNPDYVIQDTNGALILNPGIPEVRTYLYNIIEELMANYDVDGVHFDDYFYSYSGTPNAEDQAAFSQYNPQSLSRDDWRRENINELVKTIFEMVEDHNTQNEAAIKFGISPFGIWRNKSADPLGSNTAGNQSYSTQYADTRKWVKEGWLHYIMPQLYWQFDHSVARFADLVDWWVETVEGTDVDLIIGHGFYRYAETSNNWTSQDEFLEQIRYISQYEAIKGSSIFSYKTLNSSHQYVTQALTRLNNTFWTKRVGFPWASTVGEPQVIEPEPIYYDVEFFTGNGTTISKMVVEAGKKLNMPANPTQEGFEFDGWFLDASYNIAFDPNTEINSDLVLFAKWKEAPITEPEPEPQPEPQPSSGCWFLWDAPSFIFTLIGAVTLMGIAYVSFRKY